MINPILFCLKHLAWEKMGINQKLTFSLMILVTIIIGCNSKDYKHSTMNYNKEQIKEVRTKFQQKWLEADSAAVMSLMTEDVVFMPHHGDPMVKGISDLANYWFNPQYSPTIILEFSADFEGVEASGDIGYSFGRFKLSYNYEKKNYTNSGNFLTVCRKENDVWKISRLIFNDPQPVVKDLVE